MNIQGEVHDICKCISILSPLFTIKHICLLFIFFNLFFHYYKTTNKNKIISELSNSLHTSTLVMILFRLLSELSAHHPTAKSILLLYHWPLAPNVWTEWEWHTRITHTNTHTQKKGKECDDPVNVDIWVWESKCASLCS